MCGVFCTTATASSIASSMALAEVLSSERVHLNKDGGIQAILQAAQKIKEGGKGKLLVSSYSELASLTSSA